MQSKLNQHILLHHRWSSHSQQVLGDFSTSSDRPSVYHHDDNIISSHIKFNNEHLKHVIHVILSQLATYCINLACQQDLKLFNPWSIVQGLNSNCACLADLYPPEVPCVTARRSLALQTAQIVWSSTAQSHCSCLRIPEGL